MKLYNRYIFYKTASAFFAIVALLVILIWFSRTIAFVKYITENGVELQQFSALFFLILPWLLLFIVPISLFVAVLMIYNRLLISNEITILQNSGLTKISIGKSAIAISIIASLFCFLISFYLMPLANKKLRLARTNFENNYSSIAFSKGTFEVLKSLTIYVKDKNEQNQLFGILLHDDRNTKSPVTITAKEGNLRFENGSLLLYMTSGTVQRFNVDDGKSEILNFDDYVFNLNENNSKEVQKRWKAKERFLHELLHPNDDSTAENISQYRVEVQERLTYPLMPIVLVAIALAAILRGSFSRHGNSANIVIAAAGAILFLITTIAIYRFLESSPNLVPLLYFNFLLFGGGAFYALIANQNKGKKIAN